MKPTVGSILRYQPDDRGWTAVLASEDGMQWVEPVVGWAVVVVWTGYESTDPREQADRPDQFDTELQPVLFNGADIRLRGALDDGVTFVQLMMPGFVPPPMNVAPPDEPTEKES